MTARLVGLTFDGGPVPRHTAAIVAALNRHGARGTFFLVGYTAHVFPEEVVHIRRCGHELANHSMNHRNLQNLTEEETRAEIVRCHEEVVQAAGYACHLFRPPWGEKLAYLPGLCAALGYELVPVRGGVKDFLFPGAATLAERIVAQARHGDLITMHSHVPEVPEALDLALPVLREQGFRFVSVSEIPPGERAWTA